MLDNLVSGPAAIVALTAANRDVTILLASVAVGLPVTLLAQNWNRISRRWRVGMFSALTLVGVGAIALLFADSRDERAPASALPVSTQEKPPELSSPEPPEVEVSVSLACPAGIASEMSAARQGGVPTSLQARYEGERFIIHVCSGPNGPIYHGEEIETGEVVILPASGDTASGFAAVNGVYGYSIDDSTLIVSREGEDILNERVIFVQHGSTDSSVERANG